MRFHCLESIYAQDGSGCTDAFAFAASLAHSYPETSES
ncbi:protein of unknown function [Burkholderia multivorans]